MSGITKADAAMAAATLLSYIGYETLFRRMSKDEAAAVIIELTLIAQGVAEYPCRNKEDAK